MPHDRTLDVGGRRLGINALWSLAGGGLPVAFALIAIPFILGGLGTARFGVLLLVWALIGYFGLLDLGLGRALTQMTADRLGAGRAEEIPSLVWSGLALMAALGAVGGLLLAGIAGPLVRGLLAVPEMYREEVITCLRVVAFGMPLIVVAGGLTAMLAGYQEFPLINGLRIPFSALNNLGQAVVATLWPDLAAVAAVLVIARILNAVVLFWFCRRLVPFPNRAALWRTEQARMLLRFGGWITVSNVIGPFMVYLDRFVIGTMISMSAVAYYATPHEAMMRLWVVPGAIVGVLFPAFATVLQQDRQRVVRLFNCGLAANLLLLFPPTVILVGFAEPLLDAWLGPDFAAQSTPVLQIMAAAVLINSLARMPSALVQSAGRPDLTAKLHLVELVPYLFLLAWWTEMWGIVGAAMVWALRVAVDGLVLGVLAKRLLPELGENTQNVAIVAVLCGAMLLPLGLDISPSLKLILAIAAIGASPLLFWFRLLSDQDRSQLLLFCRRWWRTC